MSAAECVQAFLDLFDQPTYLEIGVQDGITLHGVKAHSKIGVDPQFRFDWKSESRNRKDTEYYEMTSDAFFGSYTGGCFDVVFIDGLHTSEQTLRDLLNTLAFVKPTSIIIVDDVGPDSYAASLPSEADMVFLKRQLGDLNPCWMGDVYRLVYFVETFMQQYSYASPMGDNARMVLWREARKSLPERTLAEVGGIDFLGFSKDMEILRWRPMGDIVTACKEGAHRVSEEHFVANVGERSAATAKPSWWNLRSLARQRSGRSALML